MIVAVTGWRRYPYPGVIEEELAKILVSHHPINEFKVRVGDAAGADQIVRGWCQNFEVSCTVYEADWDRWGPGAGPKRNRDMLSGTLDGHVLADLLLAFPQPGLHPQITGSGSWGCVFSAFRLGIAVAIPSWQRGVDEMRVR